MKNYFHILLLSLITQWGFAQTATQKRPNVVFILVDDLGLKDLSCTGSTFYETLNVDRIANEGTVFTQGYAACAVCRYNADAAAKNHQKNVEVLMPKLEK
jgi:hypothetical protein